MNAPTIFLGCPTHDGRLETNTADVLYSAASKTDAIIMVNKSSALTANCNHLYATALNYRTQYPSLKWFAMLHSDVIPEPFFVDSLIALAEKHQADFISAVIPFKDDTGLTSTALGKPKGYDYLTRLTMKQLWDMPCATFGVDELQEHLKDLIPANFTKPFLLANTGCMITRIDQPWSENLHFEICDSIEKIDGKHQVRFFPEDWWFSRSVAANGGKVMCTREVSVKHSGNAHYNNQKIWGQQQDIIRP